MAKLSNLYVGIRRRGLRIIRNLRPNRFHVEVKGTSESKAPVPGGKMVVFGHFDVEGVVAPYVELYLASLARLGYSIVFISTSSRLRPESIDMALQYCWLVGTRKNVGLDIGGWPCGLRLARKLSPSPIEGLSQILLANDSVFGPLHDLANVFSNMGDKRFDAWGITESTEVVPHIQSYFLVIEKAGLPFFLDWIQRFQIVVDRDEIIYRYEIGLTQAARAAGLRLGSLIPTNAPAAERSLSAASGVRNASDPCEQIAAPAVNPTHFYWQELIALGSPFIKRDILRRMEKDAVLASNWRTTIQRYAPDYSIDLIARELSK